MNCRVIFSQNSKKCQSNDEIVFFDTSYSTSCKLRLISLFSTESKYFWIMKDYYKVQASTMYVYAGTYQGNIIILQGDPTHLQIKTMKQVSENSIRSISLANDELFVGGYDQQFKSVSKFTAIEQRQSKESLGIINCIRVINNKLALIGLQNGTIRFWDIESWTSRKDAKQHKKGVTDIKFDKKGVIMASTGGNQLVFWNLNALKPLYHYRYDYQFQQILLSQTFEYIFLLGDRIIRKINTQNNTELFQIQVDSKIQCGLIFKNYILIGTQKGQIRIWTHQNNKQCIHFKAHQARIKDIKFINFEQLDYLVTADSNGDISVWDILEFLKEVDTISQDYNLEGLKPLTSISLKQRVICLQTTLITGIKAKNSQKTVEKVQQAKKVVGQKQKVNTNQQSNQKAKIKNKPIQKQVKHFKNKQIQHTNTNTNKHSK